MSIGCVLVPDYLENVERFAKDTHNTALQAQVYSVKWQRDIFYASCVASAITIVALYMLKDKIPPEDQLTLSSFAPILLANCVVVSPIFFWDCLNKSVEKLALDVLKISGNSCLS
jgi:hypothetical protein